MRTLIYVLLTFFCVVALADPPPWDSQDRITARDALLKQADIQAKADHAFFMKQCAGLEDGFWLLIKTKRLDWSDEKIRDFWASDDPDGMAPACIKDGFKP